MDCRTFCRNLEEYLEGGLDFPGRFGIERHAQQCYVCGKEMAKAQKLAEMARGMSRVAAPPGFEESVLARIHAPSRQGWLRSFWIFGFEWPSQRTLTVAAAVAVLAGGAALTAALLVPWSSAPEEAAMKPAADEAERAEFASPSVQAGEAVLPAESSPVNLLTPPEPPSAALRDRPGSSPNPPYSTEEEVWERLVEATDGEYLEYAVPGPGDRQFIMRLPKTIRMRHAQPSEEYFVRNVSH